MKKLSFKFQQNHTINEQFDIFEESGVEGKGNPIYKFGIFKSAWE